MNTCSEQQLEQELKSHLADRNMQKTKQLIKRRLRELLKTPPSNPLSRGDLESFGQYVNFTMPTSPNLSRSQSPNLHDLESTKISKSYHKVLSNSKPLKSPDSPNPFRAQTDPGTQIKILRIPKHVIKRPPRQST